jgi:hypothetical protein
MALNCQVYFSFTHLAHQIERHIIIWPAASVIVVLWVLERKDCARF